MQVEAVVQERLAVGDARGAATAALQALGPEVIGYLRAVLRDEDDAADAFQSFAEDLWRGLPGFAGASSLRTWAYRVASHAAFRLTDEAWRRRRDRLHTSDASRLADAIRGHTVARDEVRRSALEGLRSRLTADERALLVLRVDRQLSWKDAAHALAGEGAAPDEATLRKRFERVREKLARLAREEGLLE